ncbi:MAG: YjiH family protein [Dethiosulfovibrio sp.]|nr:YjiH family protein [Dethiosulfovibrio sp.]
MGKEEVQRKRSAFPFLFYSSIGIFMFFIPLTIGGRTTIAVDHIISAIRNGFPRFGPLYAVTVMIAGFVLSCVGKKWRRSTTDLFFFVFNAIGLAVGLMVFLETGPAWILDKNMAPYVFNLVAVPVGLIIPIGSAFLAFLVNFGLMEFAGELMIPVMRPIFRTPGRSAIDAVASFVGSYSVGLIITNNVYRNGGYTAREAAIIGTGFSTVSATFMIIVAKTLGIMDIWGLYFWTTLFVTFAVTAITVRIPPLSRVPDTLYPGVPPRDVEVRGVGGLFSRAWDKGVSAGNNAPGLMPLIWQNLKDGVQMAMSVVAAILSFGVIALALAEYTNIFQFTGYVFYPVFKLLQIPDALLAGKAASVSIADMFLPAILCKDAAAVTRFVIGTVCISEVLFFSGMLPCLMGTEIPLKMKDIFLIWFERVVLSILIVAPIAHVIFN